MKNYMCPVCHGISTAEEWNESTRDEFGVNTTEITDSHMVEGQFMCPRCEEPSVGTEITVIKYGELPLHELVHPQVLEMADYVVVNIMGDVWQVLKYPHTNESAYEIIDTDEHDRRLSTASLPIVLNASYIILNERGLVDYGK